MTNIYVLNENYEICAVIDAYESLIWTTRYFEAGDFEIYAPAANLLTYIKKESLLVRDCDIDENGAYHNVMIVESIELKTDAENGNYILISGHDLKYLLERKVVWGQFTSNETPKTTIERLLEYNIMMPNEEWRKVNNFVIDDYTVPEYAKIKKQWTGDVIYDIIVKLCKKYHYGFEIYLYNGKFVFRLVQGLDRTLSQTENTPILFSPEYSNIASSNYKNDNSNYKNVALVAGEGEGDARRCSVVFEKPGVIGFQAREIFVDAGSISSNNGEISNEKYIALLKDNGKEKLSDATIKKEYTAVAVDGMQYKINEDYELGDLVVIMNEYDISLITRVIEVIESEDENGYTIVPKFITDAETNADNDDDTIEDEDDEQTTTYPIVSLQDGVQITCQSNTFKEVFDYLGNMYPGKTITVYVLSQEVEETTTCSESCNANYYYDDMLYDIDPFEEEDPEQELELEETIQSSLAELTKEELTIDGTTSTTTDWKNSLASTEGSSSLAPSSSLFSSASSMQKITGSTESGTTINLSISPTSIFSLYLNGLLVEDSKYTYASGVITMKNLTLDADQKYVVFYQDGNISLPPQPEEEEEEENIKKEVSINTSSSLYDFGLNGASISSTLLIPLENVIKNTGNVVLQNAIAIFTFNSEYPDILTTALTVKDASDNDVAFTQSLASDKRKLTIKFTDDIPVDAEITISYAFKAMGEGYDTPTPPVGIPTLPSFGPSYIYPVSGIILKHIASITSDEAKSSKETVMRVAK